MAGEEGEVKVEDNKDNATQVEEGQQQEAPQYTEQEQQAMLLGWKPEDQFEGDKSQFRSAREFLERGEMIGKIRALSKQNSEITRAIQHMSAQQAKMYDNGYKAALADLKAEKKAALAEGDLVKAEEVQEKIDDLKERRPNPQVPQINEVDPDHEAWVSRNLWYVENKVLHNFADELAKEYVRVNQGRVTADDVRNYVEETVKKEFAHRFGGSKVVAAPSPDGAGRQSGKPGSGSNQLSALKAQMSESDLGIMKTIMKTTGMTEKEYLQQYQA